MRADVAVRLCDDLLQVLRKKEEEVAVRIQKLAGGVENEGGGRAFNNTLENGKEEPGFRCARMGIKLRAPMSS